MKAKINGFDVEGTADEFRQLFGLFRKQETIPSVKLDDARELLMPVVRKPTKAKPAIKKPVLRSAQRNTEPYSDYEIVILQGVLTGVNELTPEQLAAQFGRTKKAIVQKLWELKQKQKK